MRDQVHKLAEDGLVWVRCHIEDVLPSIGHGAILELRKEELEMLGFPVKQSREGGGCALEELAAGRGPVVNDCVGDERQQEGEGYPLTGDAGNAADVVLVLGIGGVGSRTRVGAGVTGIANALERSDV